MTQSFYELLGIEPDADQEEIRDAYREQLKETHPDVSDDPEADARTKRLVEAKETLLDPAERSRYDRIGHEAYVAEGAETRTTDADAGTNANVGATGNAARTAGTADWASAKTDAGSGPTNATTDPWERRAREDRAQERVETGASWVGETADSGTTSTGTTSAGTTSAGTTEQTTTPTDSRFDVSVEPGDVKERGPLLSIGEAPATTLAAFVLYPVLLGGAVFPAFPLWVNVVVAACTVAVIAALQAMPGVGAVVFGSWAVAGTIGLGIGGVSPLSFVGLFVLGATWFPFGLTILTAWILRP